MTSAVVGSGASRALILVALFLLALMPRLYGAQTLGWGWDSPGSFTLINFDEGGSCRAALDGFSYSTFIGRQTIGLATLLGEGPPAEIAGDSAAAKAYCHSPAHILIARSYSAVLGALTVIAVAFLTLQLVPRQPLIAWTAAALVALSGFHISESQVATVDAASVFFIYSFLAVLAWTLRRSLSAGLFLSLLLLIGAVWTKYWVFAVFAYLAFLPEPVWRYFSRGFAPWRIAVVVLAIALLFAALTNTAFPASGLYLLLACYYLLIPWRSVHRPMMVVWLLLPVAAYMITEIDLIASYTSGGGEGRFGAGYGAIGENKWLRNLMNVPTVLLVGLGIPACLFIPVGLRSVVRDSDSSRLWLCLLPVLAFALFMAFLAPVTYYRHYLALLPAAAILAAVGLFAANWGQRRWFLVAFFLWPTLLAIDLVSDYHHDPRIELRQWYREHPDARVFASYYVSPPPFGAEQTLLFTPEYALGDAATLKRASHLILSENWYDTAFANELNGPRVSRLDRLIKTKPEYVRFYRQGLSGNHPNLELVVVMDLQHFMPELLLHRLWYGNFVLFAGDLKIYRVRP